MKEEINLSCNLVDNTIGEVYSSRITTNFINLPFNYIYANTEFNFQNETYKSQGKILSPEEFESELSSYTIEFQSSVSNDKETTVEIYVSEDYFSHEKNEIDVIIKQIDLNSGVERSTIYKGKTTILDS